jgi:putative transposase
MTVLAVSERRACRVIGPCRATQHYVPRRLDDEDALRNRSVALAKEYGRYGYLRITAVLRNEGWRVNHKRVERIWRQEGLKVPQKQPKRARLWFADGSCVRRRPVYPNHVWAYDFVMDRTQDGRPLKMLTVRDEYTRECMAIEIRRRIRATDVQEVLGELFLARGCPTPMRSDNGPEFIARSLRRWFAQLDVSPLFIEPGSPWENGYVESFNGKFRYDFLDGELF